VDGRTVTGLRQAARRAKLAEFVKKVDLREAPPLQIVYLYYDAVTDGVSGKLVPQVTRDPEFDRALVHCVKYIDMR
jgi:hypothetical protein